LNGVLEVGDLRNTPHRIALRWTIENQVSTWLSQLVLVGVISWPKPQAICVSEH
jgi:hypothetical protein